MAMGINMSDLKIVPFRYRKLIRASSRMSAIVLLLCTKERLQVHWQ